MKLWASLGLTLVASIVIPGCSNQPNVAPVSGNVTLDGKPLTGGRVMFRPIASGENKIVGKPAVGQIQTDGSFVLSTFADGDGAVIGSHHPVVMENRKDDEATTTGPKIGVVTLDEVTFDVVAGEENVFTIELDSRSYEMRNAVPEKGL